MPEDWVIPGGYQAAGYVLRVRVLEAAGLPRSTILAIKQVTIHEPFCTVQLKDTKGKATTTRMWTTSRAKQTLFPLWDETFDFTIEKDDIANGKIRFCVKGGVKRLVVWRTSNEMCSVEKTLREIFWWWYLSNKSSPSSKPFQRWVPLNAEQSKAEQSRPHPSVAGRLFLAFDIAPIYGRGKTSLIPPICAIKCEPEDLGIFIGTMNCAHEPPKDLKPWLKCDSRKHKIVVVGLQEIDDGNTWEPAIDKAINSSVEKNRYKLLATHKIGEMQVFCYVDQNSLESGKVCHMSMWNEATGFGHIVKNKGATLISLDYGGTSLCFINSHLKAHHDSEDGRNNNYREICANVDGIGNIKQPILAQFHHVFWLGDLNYRCDYGHDEKNLQKAPPLDVFKKCNDAIAKKDYPLLLEHCQLRKLLKSPKPDAFFGFQEHEINFKPTYKVWPNKDYEYQSTRSQSWCDRILSKSAPGYNVTCTCYSNAPEVCTSDHKPVYGEFIVTTWERQPGRTDPLGNKKAKDKLIIDFRNCKGIGLREADVGSQSDPYLHFPRQELLNKHRKSQRKKNTINPNWDDEDLPHLELHRTNLKFLENALLLVQCRDHDLLKPNDRLGNGYLPLKSVVQNIGEWVPFEQKLTWHGINEGTLKGEYRLRLGDL